MTEWIHCNRCAIRFNTPNIKIFLTECGHMFCERCLHGPNEPICVVCQKATKAIHISKEMDQSVQNYFVPFEVHMKKIFEVYNFQMQHKTRLLQATNQKYNLAKKEYLNCMERIKILGRENKVMKSMLMSAGLAGGNQPFQTSTPVVKSDATDNISTMSSIPFTPRLQGGMVPGSAVAQRILSGNRHFKTPYFGPHLSSAGSSSMHRPSPSQLVPNVERQPNMPMNQEAIGRAYSLEQLRRAHKRT